MSGDRLVLLVTGSQTWKAPHAIYRVLEMYTRYAFSLGKVLVVMHGDCPDGADAIARAWTVSHMRRGWPVEHDPHPAAWEAPCRESCKHGPRRKRKKDGAMICQAAGIYRNIDMCELKPDFAEAFIRNSSPGASQCARYAEKLGIAVARTVWEDRDLVRETVAAVRGLAEFVVQPAPF